jgi:hypothetical protein
MDESPKRGLLAAYARLLGPLIRILIRNGVSFGEFSEVARQAYVEVASRDFKVGEADTSQKRVSVLTGLETQQIEEIEKLKRQRESDDLETNLDQIGRLLQGWHTDSDFTGPYGVPLELRFSDKGKSDFGELVRRHVGNTSSQILLDELVKINAVVETRKGWFKALKRHYIPEAAAPEGLDHLARSVEDFTTTLDFNRLETNPSNRLFERHVYTDEGILPEDLERFRQFAGSRAQLLLEEIDNWLAQLEQPKSSNKQKLITGLGIYHYIRDETSKNNYNTRNPDEND